MATQEPYGQFLKTLQRKALALGASDAKVIFSADIPVEDEVILFCKDPLCESYGKSIYCPPHVMTPESMRSVIGKSDKTLIFKLDLPPQKLLEENRFTHFRKIFKIAAELEQIAIDAGYTKSRGYAAGSCKPVFCPFYQCQALWDGKSCRYPSEARPSMEAVGISVFKLFESVGWEIHKITKNTDVADLPSGVLGGMVLVR
jgi:predicted metal-binding protein